MTVDAQILGALRRASPGSVSGGDLAARLGISRAAIWARIEDFRRLGFDIEASPHLGYRLVSAPDRLLADDLRSRLPPDVLIGRDIQVFQETASTNDLVERLAMDGVEEGRVIFAESQTRGRGRLGRRWISPGGKGLWFSVLLRPRLRPQEVTRLTIASATALVRGMESVAQVNAEIKWPNDILIRGRKVAGVLTELSAEPDCVHHVVLGIGVDANLPASAFPGELSRTATSLQIETGAPVDRPALAAALLKELDADYRKITEGRFEAVADEWERRCTTLGRNVAIRIGDRVVQGRAESLDSDGALLIRTQHGRLERIMGGDVTLEK